MVKKIYIPIFCLLLLFSCNGPDATVKDATVSNTDSLNALFVQHCNQFMDALWAIEPEWATSVGYHKYDSVLQIPGAVQQSHKLEFINQQTIALKQFELAQLSPSAKIDYLMIQNFLESQQWELNTLKQFEWNPSMYNMSGLIAYMLSEQYAPLEQRLQQTYQRITQIPAYYEAAKQQIKQPVKELVSLAIEQNEGGLYVFQNDFADSVNASALDTALKIQMLEAAAQAKTATTSFVQYLKGISTANARRFRLGKDLYDKKFHYEIQSTLTAEENYKAALERKQYLHNQMAVLSKELWPKYFGTIAIPQDTLQLIGKVIDTLSANHVRPENFQSAIEQQIPELVAFIKAKNLLFLDETKPLVIRKEPAYMAGVAGASISAPGPYDKEGNTYYNVGSLAGWPAAKAESYLREYNHYILQILNIHEAIPGHYTQLVYANRTPSIVKSILANGAMIEGWAVYTEQMMLESGYGNNEPEMWLMWYKWHLRTVCNTILDYSVHALNMSQAEAMQLLTKEAFQQKAEAEGKWKRVSVTNVQLTSYFSGYKAIYDLREKMKAKQGDKFNLRIFNEQFLSYGNAPVRYISDLMLAN